MLRAADHKQSTGSLGAHRSKYASYSSYNKDNDHDERRRRRRRAACQPSSATRTPADSAAEVADARGASGRRPRAPSHRETDGEERARRAPARRRPVLFGELAACATSRARAASSAPKLRKALSMAEELRSVDVARGPRSASSRALAEALAALRRRAARDGGGDDADADAAAERDEAQTWDRRAEGWAYERNQRLARLEAACDDARRAWRGEPYRNGDGVARRVVAAVEACLAHRAAAGYAAFLLEVRHAASMRRLHRRGDGVASRSTPSRGAEDASKKTQAGAATAVAAARAKDGQAARGAREAAMRAVARARDARLGRWLGRVGWYCPGVLSFVPPAADAIAATRTPSCPLSTTRRHRRDGRAHRGRGRLALIELLNGGALAASLAALAVEEEPQLKPAEHAVAHYGAGALFADPRRRGGVLASSGRVDGVAAGDCLFVPRRRGLSNVPQRRDSTLPPRCPKPRPPQVRCACAALAALEAAGVEFRLRHARAALERLDAAAAGSPRLLRRSRRRRRRRLRGVRCGNRSASMPTRARASRPSRVADLGAGSVRSVRTRRTSSPRTVRDVPEDPWPSPRLDPASCRFSAAAFLLPSDPGPRPRPWVLLEAARA